MRDDLRTAVRSLLSARTFTAMVLLVLALGIGAGTAIFSVVDAVVLRGLPYDQHERLVAVGERRPRASGPDENADPDALLPTSPQNYLDWAERQQVFASIAAIASTSFTLHEPGNPPEELAALRVSGAFFDVLQVRPALGRTLTSADEHEAAGRVAILSDGFWRRHFGADPAVIGRTIRLDAGPFEIAGVMPPAFEYPVGAVRPTELWVPFVVPPNQRVRMSGARSIYLQVIARLKPEVSAAAAQAHMIQIATELEREHPDWNRDTRAGVRPLADHLVGARTKSWMLMLLGAVGIVLLIACANVANLLLARASERERDIAVRASLGAGRWRLIRQLLIESLVLSAAGTVLAIVIAWWAIELLRTSMPDGVPRVASIALNVRVLLAAATLALATGVLFGIVPALQLSSPYLPSALKEASRSASAGRGRQRLRAGLVAGEIALAVVLLVAASLFVGSFIAVMRVDPGFDPQGVLVAQVSPRWEPGSRPPDIAPAFVDLAERLRQLPGVVQAAVVSGGIPLGGTMSISALTIPGRPALPNDDGISVRRVTAGYHETLAIPLRTGRHFEDRDRQGSPRVVILNESAAKQYFPGENPIGRTVIMGSELTVVGIVGDIHQTSLEAAPSAEAYVPMAQSRTGFAEIVVRAKGNPYDLVPAIRGTTSAVLPDIPLRDVRTMEGILAQRTAQRRFSMLLLGLFGVLGLVIAAVGIYGVMAYVVSQRTREIGIRMALGATRRIVAAMVLGSAARMLLAGLLVGACCAWALSSTADAFLFGLEGDDPRAFLIAALVLSAVALAASVVPARRAASVDPLDALRAE